MREIAAIWAYYKQIYSRIYVKGKRAAIGRRSEVLRIYWCGMLSHVGYTLLSDEQ